MIALWSALAFAAPAVQCDPLLAAEVLLEAGIDTQRAPVSHPELIPGLALGAARVELDLVQALREVCDVGGALSWVTAETWQAPDWTSTTTVFTRRETSECFIYERAVAVSVSVGEGEPVYRLRGRRPVALTPIGGCTSPAKWRDERVFDGDGTPVRLVLMQDWTGEQRTHSEVVVRRATPRGWMEQTILNPAPRRLLNGGSGPDVDISVRDDGSWIVVHGDRVVDDAGCRAVPGQQVWTWSDDSWTAHEGREALGLLASRGAWRFSGEDGWFLVLAQDDEWDEAILSERTARMQTKMDMRLGIYHSAWFSGLNPGFLIVAPAPWSNEEDAKRAREELRRGAAPIRQAWTAPDPCE